MEPLFGPLRGSPVSVNTANRSPIWIVQGKDFSTVLPFERFCEALEGNLVFKFINRSRQLEVDSEGLAAMKTKQQQLYPEELKFLLDPAVRTVLKLVWDLDLFIDEEGLIRSAAELVGSLTSKWRLNTLSWAHHSGLPRQVPAFGNWLTLAELKRYWVPKRRQTVKTVLH